MRTKFYGLGSPTRVSKATFAPARWRLSFANFTYHLRQHLGNPQSRAINLYPYIADYEHHHFLVEARVPGRERSIPVFLVNRAGHNDAYYVDLLQLMGLNHYKTTPMHHEWFLAAPARGRNVKDINHPLPPNLQLRLAYHLGRQAAVADLAGKVDRRPQDFFLDLEALQRDEDGVTAIDHETLFASQAVMLNPLSMRYKLSRFGMELSVLFYKNDTMKYPAIRNQLLQTFEQGYLEMRQIIDTKIERILALQRKHYFSSRGLSEKTRRALEQDPLIWLDELFFRVLGKHFHDLWYDDAHTGSFTAKQKQGVLSREITWREFNVEPLVS